jgi:ATP-dependent DNA helicase RecG
MEPKFEEVFNGFQVTLFKEKVSSGELNEGLNGELNGELNIRQQTVYKKIKAQPGINASELSNALKIPFSTIDKYIRIFLKQNLIERKGSKKTGGYYLTGQQ